MEDEGPKGNRPLSLAASRGHLRAVKGLLSLKAEVKPINKEGISALGLAAAKGHSDVLSLLLEAKGDPLTPSNKGETPLHLAVGSTRQGLLPGCSSEVSCLEILLSCKADIHRLDSEERTPLAQAAFKGSHLAVELLIEDKSQLEHPF